MYCTSTVLSNKQINKCRTEVSAELIVHFCSLCTTKNKISPSCKTRALPCVGTVTNMFKYFSDIHQCSTERVLFAI